MNSYVPYLLIDIATDISTLYYQIQIQSFILLKKTQQIYFAQLMFSDKHVYIHIL